MHRRDFIRISTATVAGLLIGDISSAAAEDVPGVAPAPAAGPFLLPALPWAHDALAPFISAETIAYHYGKHHQAYATNLNKLVAGKPEASLTLEELIQKGDGPVFNNAAQLWNHTFYWNCLKPAGGGVPAGALAEAIIRDFGSFDAFRMQFAAAATGQFGSGWAWLVLDQGKLAITKTSNADLPLKHGQHPLLTLDVWEHAYYIDYRNLRAKYADAVIDHLLNWDFATQNYQVAIKG